MHDYRENRRVAQSISQCLMCATPRFAESGNIRGRILQQAREIWRVRNGICGTRPAARGPMIRNQFDCCRDLTGGGGRYEVGRRAVSSQESV